MIRLVAIHKVFRYDFYETMDERAHSRFGMMRTRTKNDSLDGKVI